MEKRIINRDDGKKKLILNLTIDELMNLPNENEKNAILYSMAHFFDLKLSGIAMRVLDEIEAIAVYEKMSPDTVVVHYEKGSPDYDGIYKAINQETATIVQKDFNFINRESDMDLPGLRKAKMSYRPHHLVEVYVAIRDSITF